MKHTNVDVPKRGERLAKLLDCFRVGLDFLSVNLRGAFLLNVVTQVLEEDDFACIS